MTEQQIDLGIEKVREAVQTILRKIPEHKFASPMETFGVLQMLINELSRQIAEDKPTCEVIVELSAAALVGYLSVHLRHAEEPAMN